MSYPKCDIHPGAGNSIVCPDCLESARGNLRKVKSERDRFREAIFAAIQECHNIHATANSVERILMKAVIY